MARSEHTLEQHPTIEGFNPEGWVRKMRAAGYSLTVTQTWRRSRDGSIERRLVLHIMDPDHEPNDICLWYELAGYPPGGKPCRPLHNIHMALVKDVVAGGI